MGLAAMFAVAGVVATLAAGDDAAGREARPGRYVMLAVSDTGTGMSAEVMAQAFEPFFTTKGTGKGTGLGLSMVYGFAEQSGGHVEIESAVGCGTTVRLYLPTGVRPPGLEGSPTAKTAEAPPTGCETVLVTEDDDLVRRAVVSRIRGLGYAVLEARDGVSALAVLERHPVDLVLTDVVMSGGTSGPELAAAARRRHPGLKVVFTSGYAEDTIREHGPLDPAIRLLHKPHQLSELARVLRDALDDDP